MYQNDQHLAEISSDAQQNSTQYFYNSYSNYDSHQAYYNYYSAYYPNYSFSDYQYAANNVNQYNNLNLQQDALKSKTCQPCSYTTNNVHSQTPEKQNDSGIDVLSPTFGAASISDSVILKSKPTDQSGEANESDREEEYEEDRESKSAQKSKKCDEVKPPKPYLEIIAQAILSSKHKLMQLHEIYNYMELKYSYFARNVNKSWRNSVRHNLSLNECFAKAGRGSNGKGNYWRIHPLCEKEFIRGNFRRKTFKKLIKAAQMTHQSNVNMQNFANPLEYCLNVNANIPILSNFPFYQQLNSNKQ